MDIARGEMVEKELDAMIERRSRQVDPDEQSRALARSREGATTPQERAR